MLKHLGYKFGKSGEDNFWITTIDAKLNYVPGARSVVSVASGTTTSGKCLTAQEKQAVLERLAKIKSPDGWVLSSGTIVEQVPKKAVQDLQYEHPVHSLIIDTGDSLWKKHFTARDLKEMKTHKAKNPSRTNQLTTVGYLIMGE